MNNFKKLLEEQKKTDMLNKPCFKCDDGFYRKVKGEDLLVCDTCGHKVKRFLTDEEIAKYKK